MLAQLICTFTDFSGVVINVFEAVDIMALLQGVKSSKDYEEHLQQTVGEALLKRADVSILFRDSANSLTHDQEFPGIYTCSLNDRLENIFETIRKSRVHRFVVLDERSHLQGVVTLSDILEYLLLEGVEGEP